MIVAWIAGTPTASGHGIILESSPKHEETVVAPRRLTLRFNSRLEKRLCSVSLIGPGQSTILLLAQEAGTPDDTLSLRLPILGPGFYRAKWKVPSSDGHVTEGVVAFSVREVGAVAARLSGLAVETIPGMPPVVDPANLYGETGSAAERRGRRRTAACLCAEREIERRLRDRPGHLQGGRPLRVGRQTIMSVVSE